MQQDSKTILSKVLDIISYEDNKEAFIDEFLELVQARTFSSIAGNLPQEKQDELKQEIDSPRMQQIIKDIASTTEYKAQANNVFTQMFDEYIEDILPTLTKEQVKNLDLYLASLAPIAQASSM